MSLLRTGESHSLEFGQDSKDPDRDPDRLVKYFSGTAALRIGDGFGEQISFKENGEFSNDRAGEFRKETAGDIRNESPLGLEVAVPGLDIGDFGEDLDICVANEYDE